MIPKLIHCCWFGGAKTKLARDCQASWSRFAPDWTVCEWTRARAQQLKDLPGFAFFAQALAARKWAMASDWLRMAALWNDGGVYFDCDVELVAPIDDLCAEGPWVASEWAAAGGTWLNPGGGLALEKGSPLADDMLRAYAAAPFDAHRAMMPFINDALGRSLGRTTEKVRVLAPAFFAPIDPRGVCRRTEQTRGIHRYAMSGASPKQKFVKWCAWHGLRKPLDVVLALAGRRRAK